MEMAQYAIENLTTSSSSELRTKGGQTKESFLDKGF